jgi:hypothetical protein
MAYSSEQNGSHGGRICACLDLSAYIFVTYGLFNSVADSCSIFYCTIHVGRPSTAEPVNPVLPGDMRENVTHWFDWVRDFVQQQVTSLLSLVSSVRGLDGIREEASSMGTAGNWDIMCQQLLLPRGLNLWDAYFQPLITQRAKSLVSQQWSIALAQLQSTLTTVTQDSAQEK